MINIRIIIFFLLGTVCMSLVLRYHSKLEHQVSPLGIVSLELAKSGAEVKNIVTTWKDAGLIRNARQNIWLDFLFIPFYSLLFYTLCGSISVRMKGFAAKMGVMLAFFAVIAGLLDVLENILMLVSLGGVFSGITAMLTSFFAILKFILLGLALLYVIPLGLRIIFLKMIHGQSGMAANR